MIKTVTNLMEFNKLLADHSKVIVDLYADWCGPCKVISPYFELLSKKHQGHDIVFVKVNIDNSEEIASKYNIMSVPTFLAFKNS